MTVICIFSVSILNILFPYQLSFLIDSLIEHNSTNFINSLWVMFIIVIALLIFEFFSQYLNAVYLSQVGEKLHGSIIRRILNLDIISFFNTTKGAYQSEIINDIERLKEQHYAAEITLFHGIFSLLIASIALIKLDITTAITVLFASTLPVVVPYLFKNLVRTKQNDISNRQARYATSLNSFLIGFIEYKNLLPLKQISSTLEKSYKESNNQYNKAARLSAFINCLVGATFYLITFIILFFGGVRILSGQLTVGALTAILVISEELISPIHNITDSLMSIYSVKDIKERLSKTAGNKSDQQLYEINMPITIKFNNVTYTYSDGTHVLKNFTHSFISNENYLITGKSGIGKSTIANLLTKNIALQKGNIIINESSIDNYQYETVQALIAYIPQKTSLIQDTVWHNLSFSRNVDRDLIWQYIVEFGLNSRFPTPNSLNEILTEESKLSGGQKQLLVLIRALVSKRPVLLIDEGLSALDEDTFDLVEQKITTLPNLTVIHISHRISKNAVMRYSERIEIPQL